MYFATELAGTAMAVVPGAGRGSVALDTSQCEIFRLLSTLTAVGVRTAPRAADVQKRAAEATATRMVSVMRVFCCEGLEPEQCRMGR